MGGFTRFTIKCEKCDHRNRPDNNTRNGIFKTLTGEFNTCRNCGYMWDEVRIPHRPLVEKILQIIREGGPELYRRVIIFPYKGKVPSGLGI